MSTISTIQVEARGITSSTTYSPTLFSPHPVGGRSRVRGVLLEKRATSVLFLSVGPASSGVLNPLPRLNGVPPTAPPKPFFLKALGE